MEKIMKQHLKLYTVRSTWEKSPTIAAELSIRPSSLTSHWIEPLHQIMLWYITWIRKRTVHATTKLLHRACKKVIFPGFPSHNMNTLMHKEGEREDDDDMQIRNQQHQTC
jgi:hypothetical protein